MSMSSYDKYQQYMAEAEARRIANGGQTYTPTDYQAEGAAPGGAIGGVLPLGVNLATREAVKRLLGEKAKEEAVKAVATDGLQTSGATQFADAQTIAPELARTGVPTPGAFSLSNIGSAGNAVLPIAGALGVYDLLKNERRGARGALQGAASGAAMGSYFGPWGAAVGGGLGLGAGLVNNMTDKDRWKEEQTRVNNLAKKGITGWDLVAANTPQLSKGRSIDELVAIEEANKAAGKHSNVDFARTRDVKYLKPEDIWGYSAFGEKYGNDWLGKFTGDQRRDIAKAYLDAGAVKEGKGQIALKDNAAATALVAKILGGQSAPLVVVNAKPGTTTSTKFSADITKAAEPVSKAERMAKFRQEKAYN